MNWPMDYPIFHFFYWLVNTPTVGGIFVTMMAGSLLLTFGSVLRWIAKGAQAKESETFTYPTSALHEHPGHEHKE
jgi:hypothetical protein